jgi:hypothetical protein
VFLRVRDDVVPVLLRGGQRCIGLDLEEREGYLLGFASIIPCEGRKSWEEDGVAKLFGMRGSDSVIGGRQVVHWEVDNGEEELVCGSNLHLRVVYLIVRSAFKGKAEVEFLGQFRGDLKSGFRSQTGKNSSHIAWRGGFAKVFFDC